MLKRHSLEPFPHAGTVTRRSPKPWRNSSTRRHCLPPLRMRQWGPCSWHLRVFEHWVTTVPVCVQVCEHETSSSTFCPMVVQFPSFIHARARPVRRVQWGVGYAFPTCGWDLHHLWRTRAVPLTTSPLKGASVGLSPGDLLPKWFQLESTVHNVTAVMSCCSMKSSTPQTSISFDARIAATCGTLTKTRTDRRVARFWVNRTRLRTLQDGSTDN